jgi:hypothetical protein
VTGIFINYRSDDSGYAAALIDSRLCVDFGEQMVFRDARSLRPATDFPPELMRRLRESTVVLAVIGPRWLSVTDGAGARRIDNPKDYVRRELRIALRQNRHVLPILLDDAHLPPAAELPKDIAKLPRRQVLHLRRRYHDSDLDLLVAALAPHIPRTAATATEPDRGGSSSSVTVIGTDQTFHGPIVGRDIHYG